MAVNRTTPAALISSPLAVVMRLALGASARVWIEAANESEDQRLVDWINSRPARAGVMCVALAAGEVEAA